MAEKHPVIEDINKALEALRPNTKVPPKKERPMGVSAETYADQANLTQLLEIITSGSSVKPPSPPPSKTP